MLSFLWDAGPFTATDAMAVGYTRSTTIDLIDELIDRGLVRELPNARTAGEYRKGRPARRFQLDAGFRAVIGVDAGRAHVTATVADLVGGVLASHHATLRPADDRAESRLAAVQRAVDDVLAEAGIAMDQVVALCIGVPAPVDVDGVSPAGRDGFWARMNPGLRDAFPAVPAVEVMNDASLAAVAEGAVGAGRGHANYVALLAGERMGAGVVIDGRVLRGAHGGTGEMAGFDYVEAVGGAWGLGYRLAEHAKADVRHGKVSAQSPLSRLRTDEITGRTVLELARDGDPDASRIVERIGGMLATIAAVINSFFDPSRIIVSGAISEGAQQLIEVATRQLPERVDLPAPVIVGSSLGADVVSTGAIFQAIQAAREVVLRLPAPARGDARALRPGGDEASGR
ncbi:ROK family protein [Microbacterium sp. BK668]|uniref:ROK family protein n=1 Tax=Microbacterium sp. BK668 TaxID=2512118 RepID=UPI001FB75865|nr:ROK family protein [Microbacterium sp. BK668]